MSKSEGYEPLHGSNQPDNALELEFELSDFAGTDGGPPNKLDSDNDVGHWGNEEELETANVTIDGDNEDFVNNMIRENDKKSTMRWAFMNMANSILGAGVIGQPSAVKNCGIIGAILAYLVLVVLVDWTLRLIVINLTLAGKKTYQDSVEFAMGRRGRIVVLAANGLFAFGGCIGFCIIIGDTLPHVFRAFFHSDNKFLSRNAIITMVTLLVSYPLALQRNIAALSKASFLALVSMVVIVFTVIIRGPELKSHSMRTALTLEDILITPRIFRGFSVISFALVCHHNTSFIYFSIKNRSLQKFSRLTHISTSISVIFCMIMGFSGFAVFGQKTKGNILNNFPGNDTAINVARFCFGFNMLTTFPLEIFVLRDVIASFILGERPGGEPGALSKKCHFIITSILVFGTMSISLLTCNLGTIFELIGATTASTMAYILPPWANLLLTKQKKSFRQKLPFFACITFGFSIMFISSAQTIMDSVRGADQKHCEI
ncbi:ZYBA0S14-00980g1_1 [Zygosaccharomyces bailii CLIB 213]|uniref:ZYBA0S14-00980g1_1 n=1 Tax=Zygosaccharomyces bailii (strain CLIB 213 / ATCC 58445 / CBS 680 / BCRC 21525 / NBRC 1098 / NCYC 1416 / NRRL Y-2227) TaxID=1333698 RepID=A0A8J2TB05_ZYGB2|nr:ZYBA0S14-00980g1_1 [Zygosaccharomyces bailii CLIB 213]